VVRVSNIAIWYGDEVPKWLNLLINHSRIALIVYDRKPVNPSKYIYRCQCHTRRPLKLVLMLPVMESNPDSFIGMYRLHVTTNHRLAMCVRNMCKMTTFSDTVVFGRLPSFLYLNELIALVVDSKKDCIVCRCVFEHIVRAREITWKIWVA